MTEEIARRFARIALGHIAQEYPNKLDHVMTGVFDVQSPRVLHPAFFGSYDWHSNVHSWWLLLTLRRLFPTMYEATEIDDRAELTLSKKNLDIERAYLERPASRGFERPYGWAWLLALQLEASRHDEREWSVRLEPLARIVARRFADFLPVLTYPITVGTHFNTAFALTLTRAWALQHDAELAGQIDDWSMRAFAQRSDYAGWEPGGDEFLSPVLTAALLMSDVMTPSEFEEWFDRLVISNGWLERECRPVTVSDRSDGKIAHLDGLNLSRAWCLKRIARVLSASQTRELLHNRAARHLEAALPHVAGDYMGEHWLASFALLALTEAA